MLGTKIGNPSTLARAAPPATSSDGSRVISAFTVTGGFIPPSCDKTPRAMKVHEYQAKEILRRYGVPTPRGVVVDNFEDARQAAKTLAGTVVVKAQIHAGGRGKGGGVKLAKSPDEAAEIAARMLGMNLVTAQTGPEGRRVQKVLIEEGLDIRKELYLGIVIDRQTGKPIFMASASGGMDIEEVAAKNPELILKEHVEPGLGLQAF